MLKFATLGPYRIGKRIGQGGMGEVYACIHIESGQPAAIKVLRPALATAEGFRERFEAEIDSLRILNHANIVHLFGYGEQEGYLFYAMEFVDGHSLEGELCAGRRFTWREVTEIGIQVSRALKHAHDHGVIHRDLKPANLLLTDAGNIKLLDFGIARLFGATNLTSAGGVLGTADYMSPEQADGRPVSDRCDQYGLGGVLYALLTGRPPFRAATLPELLQLQRFAEPEPVRRYAPDTPEELERIILQLLAKDPEHRFPNTLVIARRMEAMLKALSRPPKQDSLEVPAPGGADSVDLGATRVYEQRLQAASDDPTQVPVESAVSADEDYTLEVTPPPPPEPHFTSMADLKRRERMHQRRSLPLMLAQTMGALIVLALVALGGWLLVRPASADALYRKVQQAAENDRLPSVAGEIDDFLARFPDDARAGELLRLRDDLLLQDKERTLRARAALAGSKVAQLPIERMYIAAIGHSKTNPERAMSELAALVDLYGEDLNLNEEEQRCLKLAQRELGRLSDRIYQYADDDLAALEERFRKAQEISTTDPQRARKMWRAIVKLGDGKPWAATVVRQAEAALKKIDEPK